MAVLFQCMTKFTTNKKKKKKEKKIKESVRKKWKPKKGIKVWVNVNKYWLYEIIKIIYCRIKNIVKYLHRVMNESECLYFLKGRKSHSLTVEFDKLNICTIILGSSKADIYTPKLKGK